ncbi:hypothetical protein HPB50_020115 [Hyalomma asiaticum]|uniref:Uncharacterized protein n=1 Tax=Hyalomma asiaticum TaxID=266040 RepID=A0ACB7S585_HYAAI|nr:hypothetical protein HPB50_020115 [Hyalomma asiaticum]
MNDRMNMAPAQSTMADRWGANVSAADSSRGLPARDSPQPPPKGRWERPRGPMTAAVDPVMEQLSYLRGPTSGLETRAVEPKKFTGRCRLFVGNLPNNFTEEQFRKLFENYGEVAEIFLNTAKGFGFVKLDTRQNAEAAKAALDFMPMQQKPLRVRFATHGAALKVKNFSQWVTNELLELAFSVFGEVERAVVIVDDRGRSVGEGIVEFSRKQAAQQALKRCSEECFILTRGPLSAILWALISLTQIIKADSSSGNFAVLSLFRLAPKSSASQAFSMAVLFRMYVDNVLGELLQSSIPDEPSDPSVWPQVREAFGAESFSDFVTFNDCVINNEQLTDEDLRAAIEGRSDLSSDDSDQENEPPAVRLTSQQVIDCIDEIRVFSTAARRLLC